MAILNPTPEQIQNLKKSWVRSRDRGRTDLFWLANEVLSPPESRIMTHAAHDIIVNHCQKFAGREEYIDKHKLSKWATPQITYSQQRIPMPDLEGYRTDLLLASRGCLKTTIQTVAHSIQWILNYPDVRILICTATEEKARLIVSKIKQHFTHNPRFRFLYPELCPSEKKISDWGSQTELTVPNRQRRGDEPTIMTAAVGKALASTHHDVIKGSDVVTENNVKTAGQIAEVKEFFGYLEPLRERFESKTGQPNPGRLSVEGTIYDFSDHHQSVLDREGKNPNSTWKITKQSCWRDKDKTIPWWPERFPIAELDRILSEIGPVLFSSQYELDPISPSDGLATPDQIRFFPAHLINELMPRYSVHTTVDLASMDPQTEGDSTVFSTCGFDRDGRCDVLSIAKGRFTLDRVLDLFFAIDRIYPSHISFKIQKDHFARTIEPMLRREMVKRNRFLNVTLIPISTRISKQQRIRGLQGWFMNGLIRFADNISCRNDLILEILRFPKYAHDDILDTLADQMQNTEGRSTVDIYPDPPKGYFGMPVQNDKFLGFDPITCEQRWLHDQLQPESSFYHERTGI